MSSPQRFLYRALLFLAIAAVVAAVLFPVIWRAFRFNPWLNGLILGVLLVGIVFNLRRILALKPAIEWIEAHRMGAPLSRLPQPAVLAPILSVIGERDRKGRTQLSPAVARYLLDSTAARLDESREIARYQTSLLIFLGLLGTFWGLIEALGAIGTVISGLSLGSGDFVALFDELKEGLRQPISGMGTAFGASLFGLAGSLVVGFLDLQATQAQNGFTNELEEWLTSMTRYGAAEALPAEAAGPPLPAYVTALLQQTAENLDRLQAHLARGEDGRAQLAATLHQLSERLGALGDGLARERELVSRLAELQEELARALARPTPVLDETMRAHIRNLDLQLGRLAEEITRGRNELLRELRTELRVLARTVAASAGAPALLKE
ncbi:MAG: flagellar motor protein MotA [Geminicoccaceae bacterium]|nr:MotA/TolQ/ExbB proton channel family protein [Geminicoccaceae bacterium]MDW8340209.1 flagellar motor protein MotA [Geminicoccaceae bacterium]